MVTTDGQYWYCTEYDFHSLDPAETARHRVEAHGDPIPGLLTTITPELLKRWERSQVKAWLGRIHCEWCRQIFDTSEQAVGHFEAPGMECYLFDPARPPAELPPEAVEPLIQALGIRVMDLLYHPEP